LYQKVDPLEFAAESAVLDTDPANSIQMPQMWVVSTAAITSKYFDR
jgi:hypothetical protein